MGETTNISWCDSTLNPWIGCTKVSPACDGCYADALMGASGRYKRAEWGGPGKGDGTRVRTAESTWNQAKRWDREQAARVRRAVETGASLPPPWFVFCASLADVFDNAVPPEWRRDLFDLISATPNLTWLLLTKRPGNIIKLFDETLKRRRLVVRPDGLSAFWPRNAAIGCTIVTQEEADREIPKLLAAKAALKPAFAFVSMEPLLGPVDLTRVCIQPRKPGSLRAGIHLNALRGHYVESGCSYHGDWDIDGPLPSGPPVALDWVIAGGETDQGPHKARKSHPAWFRQLRDDCAAAGVPFHFKQWGEWSPVAPAGCRSEPMWGARPDDWPHLWRVGKKAAGRTLDGVVHDARPEVRAHG